MSVGIASFESKYQKLTYLPIAINQLDAINSGQYNSYIKVLLAPKQTALSVDFKNFYSETATLFFINAHQLLKIQQIPEGQACLLLIYNRDFYCVQIHDAEVACDGLLFNNIVGMPNVSLSGDVQVAISQLFESIYNELQAPDNTSEEMMRTYLKQIIIHATRLWKKQHLSEPLSMNLVNDQEVFRDFGRLLEIHFREKHSVADYAEMLHFAPKTLTNKFNKLNLENPNDFIKNRIVLEAKRLLFYTTLTVKEISYQLGYNDPAYFNRMFTQKVGVAPLEFRKTSKTES